MGNYRYLFNYCWTTLFCVWAGSFPTAYVKLIFAETHLTIVRVHRMHVYINVYMQVYTPIFDILMCHKSVLVAELFAEAGVGS